MKLLAPLLSFVASGTIGRAVTFIRKAGKTHAIQIPVHADAKTEAQKTRRVLFGQAKSTWSHIFTNSATRAEWTRLNTNILRKSTGYTSFMSNAIRLLASGSTDSIAVYTDLIAGPKVKWTMVNIPSGLTGDEAGDFEIWTGPAATKMTLRETTHIIDGTITTSAIDADGTDRFLYLKKGTFYRSGIFDARTGGSLPPAVVPVGMVQAYAGLTVPTGWLLCDGAAVARALYSELFTAIGTIYGAGDGSTTFNLPSLVGKFLRGGVPDGVANPEKTKMPTIAFAVDNDNANHDHGTSTVQSGNHHHDGTSGNQSAAHNHTITTADEITTHTHTGTSGNQSADHTHSGTTAVTDTVHTHIIGAVGHHSHRAYYVNLTYTSDGSIVKSVHDTGSGYQTATAGGHNHGGNTGNNSVSHTHTFTSGNVSADHNHTTTTGNQSDTHSHTGTTANQSADHTHDLTTGNQSDDHTHEVNAANATHNHALTGGDAETVPVHVLMNYIIKSS